MSGVAGRGGASEDAAGAGRGEAFEDAVTAAARLPFIDRHSVVIGAAPEHVWGPLLDVLETAFTLPGARRLARALSCEDADAGGPRPLAPGSTLPGFRVAVAEESAALTLVGGHRFSRYSLSFELARVAGERTLLDAETRAAFPGFRGRLYRGIVIGSRGHALAVDAILAAVRRRTEGEIHLE